MVYVAWANANSADEIRKMGCSEQNLYEQVYLRCSCEDNLAQEVMLTTRTPSGTDQSGMAPCWVGLVRIPIPPSIVTSVYNLLTDINRKATVVHTCPEWVVWTESRVGAVSSRSATD